MKVTMPKMPARPPISVPMPDCSGAAAHGFTVVVVLFWIIAARFLPPYLLPGPEAVFKALLNLLTDHGMLSGIGASAWHVGAALINSFFLGSVLALLSREVAMLDALVMRRLLPFINSFPGIGWAILALMWFGIGHISVIFTITLVLTPLALINMRTALDNVDAELIEMAFSFGRGRLNILRKIVLPSIVSYVFATFRINFGTAWKITLTAELFGGGTGLGYLLNVARQGFDMATIFAIFIVIIAFVLLVEHLVFRPLQRVAGGV